MHQYRNNPENGSTLVVTVLVLVILSILGIAALNLTNTELLIARNMKLNLKAFYNAETGIYVAIEQIRDSIYDEEGPYPITSDSYKVNATENLNEGGNVYIYKITDSNETLISEVAISSNEDKYELISKGYKKDSVEEISIEIEEIKNLMKDVPGALSVFNPSSEITLSGNMKIEGDEDNDKYSLYLDDSSSNFSDPEGSAELDPEYDDLTSSVSDQSNDDWTNFANRLKDIVTDENTYDDGNQISIAKFGDIDSPAITLVDGCDISGGDGYGVLIIKGSVKISGNFQFWGLVINYLEEGEEGSELEFDIETKGTSTIYGAYVTTGASSNININGNPKIIYSTLDLETASNAARKAILIKKSWKSI